MSLLSSHLPQRVALAAVALVAFAARPGGAQTVSLVVPGTSDPWLAGMPAGSTASVSDHAPAQSPVLVAGLPIASGGFLTFVASGVVGHPGDPAGPDGAAAVIASHTVGAENGISNVTSPIDALLGVFLGPAQPNLSAAPGALSFSTAASRDFLALSPGLKQVFFIGDGRTSGAAVQQFVIPAGATRLYLGTMDGFEWSNNVGSFDVRVTQVVPEPAAWALLAEGLAALGAAARRRR